MWACLYCYSVSPKSSWVLKGIFTFQEKGVSCGRKSQWPSMAILFLFLGQQMVTGEVRWCGWSDQQVWHHRFMLSQAWVKNHGNGQFHPPFSPLSQELCGASCGWTSMSIFACNHLLYKVFISVVADFLISLMFSSNFLTHNLCLLSLSHQRVWGERRAYLELNFRLVLNHDICISISISGLYSSEDSIQ